MDFEVMWYFLRDEAARLVNVQLLELMNKIEFAELIRNCEELPDD